jgi:hypothetical protein
MRNLTWNDLNKIGTQDNSGRWYPIEEVREYFDKYRAPSRAFPFSYAKAAMTKKFAKWCEENRPDFAQKIGN